ncbi:hypothetical protein GCM10010266_08820 [Streptomyces griseomycini]|nr:hypothetical protein GCM10010266_08820 [Streptomyces griseomycini]
MRGRGDEAAPGGAVVVTDRTGVKGSAAEPSATGAGAGPVAVVPVEPVGERRPAEGRGPLAGARDNGRWPTSLGADRDVREGETMAEPTPRRDEPRLRPAPLLFEPAAAAADPEHFFDLESIEDPRALLERATELTLAFRAAADRAMEFQAMAAAQLADPRRFDRLTAADIAEHAEWTEDYTKKMIEFGRDLMRDGEGRGDVDPM